MASKVFVFLKILLLFVYNGSMPAMAKAVAGTQNQPSEVIFYIFFGMMWAPELALMFSKSFRLWMKKGIEDADGELHKEDIKDLRVHYSALMMLRVFVLFSLLMIFYQLTVPNVVYMAPFAGSVSLEGAALFKNIYGKRS